MGCHAQSRPYSSFRQVVGAPVVSKELLSQRTTDYQNWVEAFARNHNIPIEWADIRPAVQGVTIETILFCPDFCPGALENDL